MKFDMQGILEQAQKMQEEMNKVKQAADNKIVTEESGGGMVKVTINGAYEIIQLKIAKEIVNPEDIEMLEDLVVAAFNKAVKSACAMVAEEMNKVTGMLPNIPGLNLPF